MRPVNRALAVVAVTASVLAGGVASADDAPSPSPPNGEGPVPTPMSEDRSAELPRFPSSVDELSAPRLPAPFALPELSHPDLALDLAWTLGFGTPVDAARTTSVLALATASFEGSWVFPRRLYFGATLPIASALAPDGTSGNKFLAGNLETHIRVVFPLPSWLAFGALLAVVAPTAKYNPDSAAHAAALEAIALDPTNLVLFEPNTFALRPGFDLRVLRGPFVVQARQGLDIALDSSGRAVTVGRFLGHGGVRVRDDIELSIEATELYQFDERTPDDKRTAITVAPGARFLLPGVDVGASVVTNVFSPLSTAIDHFVALRVSLIAHLNWLPGEGLNASR